MRRLFEKLANVLAAVAFAEEGDAETAKQLLADEPEPEERGDRDHPHAPLLPPGHRPLAKSS